MDFDPQPSLEGSISRDPLEIRLYLLGLPYGMKFELTGVTVKTMVGGYTGEWRYPPDKSVRNADGQCSIGPFSNFIESASNERESFNPVNLNQVGFKECRRPLNISKTRNSDDDVVQQILLGSLKWSSESIVNFNGRKPGTITLEYRLKHQPQEGQADVVLKKGKITITPSEFGFISVPTQVKIAISDMDGSNSRALTVKTETEGGQLDQLNISILPSKQQERKLGIGLSAGRKTATAFQEIMGTALSGIVFGTKLVLPVVFPVAGTLIVAAIEIPSIIDLGIAVVKSLMKLAKALWAWERDPIFKALRKFLKAWISYGAAVASLVIGAKGSVSGLGKSVWKLFAKHTPAGGWPKDLGKAIVTNRLWMIVEELLQGIADNSVPQPSGIVAAPRPARHRRLVRY
ncbi:hypothetical protein TWF718_006357 [Orbilia javanica]|uniref:Uncharacterized protein n=1 Tax=Orbilia javanica TaxID=47235 RepID=A0AAN8MWF7_9PEZI